MNKYITAILVVQLGETECIGVKMIKNMKSWVYYQRIINYKQIRPLALSIGAKNACFLNTI